MLLPRVTDSKPEISCGRRQRPNIDAQGKKDVLEGQPRCAVGEAGGRVVMQEGQAHFALGRKPSLRVAASGRGVVRAFDHQVIALKLRKFKLERLPIIRDIFMTNESLA